MFARSARTRGSDAIEPGKIENVGDRPKTKCGLVYGGCALCSPEQSDVVDLEREARELLKQKHLRQQKAAAKAGLPPPTISDFNRACPPEFSKSSALKTAVSMIERYGPAPALKRAKKYSLNYLEQSWGWKHWQIVIKRIRLAL